MKVLYYILTVLAGAALLVGVIAKIWIPDTVNMPGWMEPQVLWRGSVGAAALAIVFLLMDIRDILFKQQR